MRLLDGNGNLVTSDSLSSINAVIITGSGSFVGSTDQVQLSGGLAIFTNLRFSAADTYNLRFTINTASFTVDSAAFVISGGTPAKLRITGSSSQVAGATQNLTITALDAASNVASSYTGDKSLTFSFDSGVGTGLDGTLSTITDKPGASQSIGTSTTISFTDGVAVVNGATNGALRLVRTGEVILNVSDGALSASGSDRLTVNVTPGASHNLTFTTQPSLAATAGVTLTTSPVVAIRDQFLNPTTATNSVALAAFTGASCSGAGGGTLSGGSSTPAVSGAATFGISYTKAETIYLQATSSGLTSACSNGVTVSPASSAALNVVTQPAGATSGAAFTTQPTVEIRDSFGNRITSDSASTVTASLQSGPGSLHASSTLTVTAASGLATFTNLRLDTAGSYVLRFVTSAGVFSTTSSAFVVGPGAPTQLTIATQPGAAVAGADFGTQPVVQLRDASNNVVSSDNSSTVTAAIQSGSGTFFVTSILTVTVVNGVANFTNLRIDKKDPYVLRFSTSAGAFTVNSSSFNVNAGTATSLAFSTQPGSATAGSPFGSQPIVETRDSAGNFSTVGLPGSVTISITLSAGAGPLQGTTSGTTGSGTAIFNDLRIDSAGANKQLTASASGLTSGVSNPFTVTAAALNNFAMVTVGSQTAGVPFTLTVTAQDVFSNTVTSFSGTVALTTTAGIITPTTSAAFANGVLTQPVTVTLAGPAKHKHRAIGCQGCLYHRFPASQRLFWLGDWDDTGESFWRCRDNGEFGFLDDRYAACDGGRVDYIHWDDYRHWDAHQ